MTCFLTGIAALPGSMSVASAEGSAKRDALENEASWHPLDADAMVKRLRTAMDQWGVSPNEMDQSAEEFLEAIESQGRRSPGCLRGGGSNPRSRDR